MMVTTSFRLMLNTPQINFFTSIRYARQPQPPLFRKVCLALSHTVATCGVDIEFRTRASYDPLSVDL
eukprot:6309655-Amphidinium_carterae.1